MNGREVASDSCKPLQNALEHLAAPSQTIYGDQGCGFSCDLHPMMNEPLRKICCIQFTGLFSKEPYGEILTEKKRLIEALEKQDSLTKF